MTTDKSDSSSLPLGKFGLAHLGPVRLQPPRGRSAPSSSSSFWVPIRNLGPQHRRRILDHLLTLDERDRYLRFGAPMRMDALSRYVASIDFRRDEVFGIFSRRQRLLAVAHLAAMPGQHVRGAPMEFGVSVLPEARGQGLGLRLFRHAVTHARNRGASHLVVRALAENAAMLRVAAKAGAEVENDGHDVEGWLKLPGDTVATHLDSSFQAVAAEALYRLKYWKTHLGNGLRMRVPCLRR